MADVHFCSCLCEGGAVDGVCAGYFKCGDYASGAVASVLSVDHRVLCVSVTPGVNSKLLLPARAWP